MLKKLLFLAFVACLRWTHLGKTEKMSHKTQKIETFILPYKKEKKHMVMKRLFDLSLCVLSVVLLDWVMVFVCFAIKLTSPGPVLYWSDRVGRNNVIFKMPKFRSMRVGTPTVATHLLDNPNAALMSIGGFLRRSSLDELPQLWSILIGDMIFIGPSRLI